MKRLSFIVEELSRHRQRMAYARAKIEQWALDEALLEDDERVETLDAFVWRFTKLQDAMGQKLFPAVLEILQEPVREMAMLDRLARLEQLEYLQDAEHWQALRHIRNELTHTYPWEQSAMLEALAMALQASYEMETLLDHILNKIQPYLEK